jgi:cadmium resistance protein CadD (predicted permease)
MANGGDNIGTYVPLFATLNISELGSVVLLFLALTGLRCVIAHGLVQEGVIGASISAMAGVAFATC